MTTSSLATYYVAAVDAHGVTFRLSDLSYDAASRLFDAYSNQSGILFCAFGECGDNSPTNLYCVGASF